MSRPYQDAICRALADIPDGACPRSHHRTMHAEAPFLLTEFTTTISGRGSIQSFAVFPGVEVSYDTFLATQAHFCHAPLSGVIEFYYCHTGRVGWQLDDGTDVYLGGGDLTIHNMGLCTDSTMLFPLGYFEGIAISIDFARFTHHLPPLLVEAGFDAAVFAERYAERSITIPSSRALECLFYPLYEAPEALRGIYLMLKLQELLLYLARYEPPRDQALQLLSEQTELVRQIHADLTAHLDQRFTMNDITRLYPINSTTFKRVFKAIYGEPLASYMTAYRMRVASERLRETNDSIADIAAQVGYETQSKFTQAFKRVTGMLPRDVRRSAQKHT